MENQGSAQASHGSEAAPEPPAGPGDPVISDWQAAYRHAVQQDGVAAVLARHPRADRLDRDFSVGAYLRHNPDVANAVASAGEAVVHYLEYGHAEARNARPDRWSPSFVRHLHGLDLPDELTARDANARLRQAGIGPADALLCEADLWAAKGLCGTVFPLIFDDDFYVVAAEAMGHPVPEPGRLAAIAHFCQTGLAHGIPPHPDHVLDPAFYLAALDHAQIAPPPIPEGAALLRHWACVGVRAGAHANPKAWFFMQTGVALPEAVLAGLAGFRAASADLGDDADLARTLAHLVAVPMPGAAAFDPAAPGVAGFLVDLARHKRNAGDAATAEWLLSRVVGHAPDDPRASLDLADLIHTQNRVATEIQLRRAVPPDFDTGANAITLAERLVVQGRFREALTACADLPQTVFGDVALNRRRRAVGGAIFNTIWSDLHGHLSKTPVPEVQTLLADALALYTPPFTPPQRSAPIRRVAILANDDLYQCKLYRADQKIDQLRAAGYHAELFVQSLDIDRLKARLDLFDAVIFMRVPAFPPVIDLIAAAAQQGLATFYDCDDLIFDPALFPPPLDSYAGQITKADHAAIACGVPLFRHAMAMCSHGIASTQTIAAAMAGVVQSGQVFLHPNALGGPHLSAIRRGKPALGGKLVLFYGSGTKAHKSAFAEVLEPALADVLADRPGQVEIRIIGEFPEFRHLDPAHPDVRVIPPIWDFESFCAELAQADINLSVLEPSVLTDSKSEIKWMEAAMFAIPSVVSPTATHRAVIADGVTGCLATDRAGFKAAMLRLIDDRDLAARIGAAARDTVLADYSLPAMGARLDAMFAAVRPVRTQPKQRLLIVNVFYPPQDIGGATRVVQDNVTDLVRRHGDTYDIDVLATLEGGETPYELACHARDGARIWTVTARAGIDDMTASDHKMADIMDRVLDRVRPDLVHLHCIQRLTASVIEPLRRRGLPYVVTLHDGWWVSPNQFLLSPEGRVELYDFTPGAVMPLPDRARITQRGLADAAAVLAVSEAFADLHRKAGIADVDTVENGVSDLPESRRVAGAPGRVRLGHVGGAARHKGYMLLRAAIHAQRFENLDLLVVDHALPPGRIRHEDWNGTPVTFVPRVPLARVGALYGALDVLLAPSVWPESYGLVTREALAAGLWVVASDQGAIGQDVRDGENGFLVDIRDHRGLAAGLARIDAAPERFKTPPAHRPVLRPATAQVDDLHRVYQRILAAASLSEDEI